MTQANARGDEAAWFWPRVAVVPGEGCWLWTGAVHRTGYGVVKVEGRQHNAHRVALGLPEGLVLHKCGVRLCCRPDHLYVGTAWENAADRERHGRTNRPRGERNAQAKLTAAAVDEMRAGGDPKELARRYGVGVSHVYRIRRGERW